MKGILTIIVLLILFFVSFSPVLATGIWDDVTCHKAAEATCKACDLYQVINNIVQMLAELTFAIGALMIVAGGVMMMISAGNEERFSQGKKFITNAVIGIVIAVGSWIIVSELFHLMAGGGVALPWKTLPC